jgi:hypothetical protein
MPPWPLDATSRLWEVQNPFVAASHLLNESRLAPTHCEWLIDSD